MKKQLTALLTLWALAMVVFTPCASAAAKNAPEGMVYCPLSRKFQPVNPIAERKQLFEEICASNETKAYLVRELFIKNLFKKIDGNNLDKLAFDYLAHGKSALDVLPSLPNLPGKQQIKKLVSTLAAAGTDEHHPLRKQAVQPFSPNIAARPPTAEPARFYTLKTTHQSAELARRLAPRAPPARS